MAASPALSSSDKKPWWLSTRKVVDKQLKEAKSLISSDVNSALCLLDSVLTLSPRCELAVELKARCLLHLRRYKDIADMLQDYIPSYKLLCSSSDCDDSASSGSSENSSQPLNRDRVNSLQLGCDSLGFKCLSVSDLKNRILAGLSKSSDVEGHWRYIVLGQACFHLGLMEDAIALLQTGKRLAAAAFRRRSNCQSDDSFSDHGHSLYPSPLTESDTINHLIAQIKLLLRRRTAAVAALDAGLYAESIRHFSKILDGRRPAPPAFLAECHLRRSSAFGAAGRIAEAIADANKTLALDPASVTALIGRASLFELTGCLADSVHDLEHAKLLMNSVLRDRRCAGAAAWKNASTGIQHREIPGRLCQIAAKMQRLKARIASGEMGMVDYYALIGVRKGCSRSELDRAHLLLVLKHKPDRATGFVDRCEYGSESERDEARDRARMSSVLLYRLIMKGYSSLTAAIAEAEKERRMLQEAQARQDQREQALAKQQQNQKKEKELGRAEGTGPGPNPKIVYQATFCRDLAVVGSVLSKVGYNRPLSVKYEALSC